MNVKLKSCTIRNWRKADVESLALHANDIDIWRNLPDIFPHPYTIQNANDWIQLQLASETPVDFAISVRGQAVGAVALRLGTNERRRTAEVGYWLGAAFRGRHIVSESVEFITKYAFDNYVLNRIEASVFGWNQASMRVLEKCGYEREACLRQAITKDGQTTDLIIYSCLPS